jgi:hypothetical protein
MEFFAAADVVQIRHSFNVVEFENHELARSDAQHECWFAAIGAEKKIYQRHGNSTIGRRSTQEKQFRQRHANPETVPSTSRKS